MAAKIDKRSTQADAGAAAIADNASDPAAEGRALLATGAAKALSSAPSAAESPAVAVATICGADDSGRPLVTLGPDPVPMSAECVWLDPMPVWADCVGLGAVVGFLDGVPDRPIVLGILGPPNKVEKAAVDVPEALVLEGEKELVLRCGEAKISMRADGRITILGGQVVTRAKGANKIRGGSVQIN